VLGLLDAHLRDRRLHVVAAPGSGKTVLGLEVFRRLAQPAVVLSPTRTIRDQWIERLGDFGCPAPVRSASWLSRDLADLKFFNSLTYQALHTRGRLDARDELTEIEDAEAGELEDETEGTGPRASDLRAVIAAFVAAGIRTLILDEAHHLRAEWWDAIRQIVEGVPELVLVSLTATPPYDVVGHEWNRYLDLCGPIDEEISVPELVKAGTLCPHQDYIWLTRCAGASIERLQAHRGAVTMVVHDLMNDSTFMDDLLAHAWIRQPESHLPDILRSPDAAIALVAVQQPRNAEGLVPLMDVLDLTAADVPAMSTTQWEHLIRHYVQGDGFDASPDFLKRRAQLTRRLRADGLMWRRELNLVNSGRRWPRLALSAEKVAACLEIHRMECESRQDSLCQVILTDYIRDEEYRHVTQRSLPLGAWPIFHALARGASPCRREALALHTGRLSIIHENLVSALASLLPPDSVETAAVPALSGYQAITVRGDQSLTRALTQLLADRQVQVLVGTRALLGEGWDAPPVNSLILASVVGSFMTTNQMRGRAIRVDRQRPDKVASIWHIGAFAQVDPVHWDIRDIEDMRARFETFVGLSHAQPLIEGGLDRLSPHFRKNNRTQLPINEVASNREMTERLSRRGALRDRWQAAIDSGAVGRVLPTVRVPRPPRLNMLHFSGTFAVLLAQVAAIAGAIFGLTLSSTAATQDPRLIGYALIVAAMLVTMAVGPRAIRLGWLFLRHLPVDGSLKSIAQAVRVSLCNVGLLPEDVRYARILLSQEGGGHTVALAGGSFSDQSLFAESLNQALGPVDAPRYLITRSQHRWRRYQMDYHAVPTVLGATKERASAYLKAWRKHVSPGDLIYTRTDDGRAALVKAKMRAYANAHERECRRIDRWH